MRLLKKIALVIVGLFVGLVVLGMLVGEDDEPQRTASETQTDDSESPAEAESSPTEEEEPEVAGESQLSDDCVAVHPSMRDGIQFGIKKKTNAKLVGKGYAVRSDAYDKVWMVGYELDGPGLEGKGDVAVWGTNGHPRDAAGSGLILQANGLSEQFSVWGEAAGEGSSADLSPADHGVAEAVECVLAS